MRRSVFLDLHTLSIQRISRPQQSDPVSGARPRSRTIGATAGNKQINYPGSGNYSQLSYDGLGRYAQILEYSGGSLTSTKNLVWCGNQICEARDNSGNVTSQYFGYGQTISGTNYFYTRDHLGSVREVTNGSGVVQAQYAYGPYGQVTLLQGTNLADFQYAGYYLHQRSGLSLSRTRAYSANLGRFISRDMISELGGSNLYAYVQNEPINVVDPFGLDAIGAAWGAAVGYGAGAVAGGAGGTLVAPGVGTIAGGAELAPLGGAIGSVIGSAIPGAQIQQGIWSAMQGIGAWFYHLGDKFDQWGKCVSILREALKDCKGCHSDAAQVQCEKDAWADYERCVAGIR